MILIVGLFLPTKESERRNISKLIYGQPIKFVFRNPSIICRKSIEQVHISNKISKPKIYKWMCIMQSRSNTTISFHSIRTSDWGITQTEIKSSRNFRHKISKYQNNLVYYIEIYINMNKCLETAESKGLWLWLMIKLTNNFRKVSVLHNFLFCFFLEIYVFLKELTILRTQNSMNIQSVKMLQQNFIKEYHSDLLLYTNNVIGAYSLFQSKTEKWWKKKRAQKYEKSSELRCNNNWGEKGSSAEAGKIWAPISEVLMSSVFFLQLLRIHYVSYV